MLQLVPRAAVDLAQFPEIRCAACRLACALPDHRRMRFKTAVLSGTLALLLALPALAFAQDAEALAKQTQNPVASLISVPLQGNWDFGLGDDEETATLLNIQPVMPFGVSHSTNVILRVIMPLTSQPGPEGTRINGLGDIVATAFFSPIKSGRIIWGAG